MSGHPLAEDEALELSLAVPPLCVLRADVRCRKCRKPLHAVALGCGAFQEADDDEPLEAFHFLHHVRSLPRDFAAFLTARCAGWRMDGSDGERHFTNHCACGAVLGDDSLHGDVGAPFWPDTPEGYAKLRVFLLPVRHPIAIDCGYTLGGGEHLDLAQVEYW